MTDVAPASGTTLDPIGPGRLVLVVGPSGAGKDTLIELARTACAGDPGIIFPRRVVTREPSSFEKNDSVSPVQFEQMLARGDFAFHWQAHGLAYGLLRATTDHIRSGHTVVVNVSRTIIELARRSYANVIVVLVTAPTEVLAQRIAGRSRSSDGPFEGRLHRNVVSSAPDVVISNVESAEKHASELLSIIRSI